MRLFTAMQYVEIPPCVSFRNTPAWESKAECPPRPLGHPSGSTFIDQYPMGMHAGHVLQDQDQTVPLRVKPATGQYFSGRQTQ